MVTEAIIVTRIVLRRLLLKALKKIVKALKNVDGEYNIVIAITEDSIVDWQKNGSYDDSVYVHNHVLRAIINNTWGENLKLSLIHI